MSTSAVLSVRVSPEEKLILQGAADKTRSTISEFIRRKALEAAEMELMTRRIVSIPEEQWAAFEAMLNAPVREVPALAELARRTPSWEK